MGLFTRVTSEDIKRLNPQQLVELLRILLHCEAKVHGMHGSSISVPLNINVPDGGEDGRWKGDIGPTDYVPNKFTIFQSKAQELSPKKCFNELFKPGPLKKGEYILKEKIQEVLDDNGCYVFFCGNPYSKKSIDDRIKEICKGLKLSGRVSWESDQIEFYDANKISDWVSYHLSAFRFVCECCHKHIPSGFKNWDQWSKKDELRNDFYTNERLDGYLKDLREHLSQPKKVARIVGLSGLGKTRLALEAFRPVDNGSDISLKILSEAVAYFDFNRSPQEFFNFIEQANLQGFSGIVVADNCSKEDHLILEDLIRVEEGKLSLLSIDFVSDKKIFDNLHITLDQNDLKDVTEKILRARFLNELNDAQVKHVAEFANGYPPIAIKIAEVRDSLDLDQLNEKYIADKMLWGREPKDDVAFKVITTVAIFKHVGVEEPVANQGKFVREVLCDNISERDFLRICKRFKDRRILQQAGDYIFVTPQPLAIALASDWWELSTAEEFNELIPKIEKHGLVDVLCDQLEKLNAKSKAHELASQLCGDTGPFGNAEVLNSEAGSRLFRAMVELNPPAALNALWRNFGKRDRIELICIRSGRRNLVSALEKLCWGIDTFPHAAALLLDFASAENESWANNATNQFTQLFQLHLSGTQMPAINRLEIIRDGLYGENEYKRKICVDSLIVALNSHHFSRSGGVEVQGAKLPEEDWTPTNFRDVGDYWIESFRLIKYVILEKSSLSDYAQQKLGHALRGILIPPILNDLEEDFFELAEANNNFWPEAHQSINDIFAYDQGNQTSESLEKLKKWLNWISPKDIENRLKQIVSVPAWGREKDKDGNFINVASQNARVLAEELAPTVEEIKRNFNNLLRGEQREAFSFGYRLAELLADHIQFIEDCLKSLREIPLDDGNPSLLSGFLHGLSNRKLITEYLNKIAEDEQLIYYLIPLTISCEPIIEDLERVKEKIILGKIPHQDFRKFSFSRVLDDMKPEDLLRLFKSLTDQVEKSKSAVFEVISHYTFRNEERWKILKPYIKKILSTDYILKESKHSVMDSDHWQNAVTKMLEENTDEVFAISITKQIVDICLDHEGYGRCDFSIRPVLELLIKKYHSVTWPIVAHALENKAIIGNGSYNLYHLLGKSDSFRCIDNVIWNLPSEKLIKWAKEFPSNVSDLFTYIGLYYVDKEGNYQWHPMVIDLLENCYEEDHYNQIRMNFSSFGSSGSRVPYIENRINLFKRLIDHPDSKLQKLARILISDFEVEKERELKKDAEHRIGAY